MEKRLNKILDESLSISSSLIPIEGQMIFFSRIIDNCMNYKEGMSYYVRLGHLEKKLDAIYSLLHYEIKKIKKYNQKIAQLADLVEEE